MYKRQLADLGGKSGDILEVAVKNVIQINAENKDHYRSLVNLSEKVVKVNMEKSTTININGYFETTSISFKQLKIKP